MSRGRGTRRGGHRRAGRRQWPTWRTAVRLGAAAAILAGLYLVVSVYSYRAAVHASAQRLLRSVAASPATRGPAGQCTAPGPSTPGPAGAVRGVLEIPAIGLRAPVLAGTGATALDSGVGHLDGSRWPDQGGATVLEAHNVTFFTRLPALHAGDSVRFTSRCRSWTYQVASHAVVAEGDPVTAGPAPSLVLVTCWPTDALYFTSHRYVVTATLTATSGAAPTLPAGPAQPPVTAATPAGLRGTDLGPDAIGAPLGVLRVVDGAGAVVPNTTALRAANEAVRLLSAGHLEAVAARRDWWRTTAPTLPFSAAAPLRDLRWRSRVDALVRLRGGRPVAVVLTAQVGASGGRCGLVVVAAAHGDLLTVTRVEVRRLR